MQRNLFCQKLQTHTRSGSDKHFADLSVQIVAPANVDHLEMARRAAFRQKPFNTADSGYRGSLNWMTLIGLPKDHLDEPIVWVSDNSQDFGDEDGVKLHSELLKELAGNGLEERIRWCRNVQELALLLASQYSPAHAEDIARIQEHLHGEILKNFIQQAVSDDGIGESVDPRECALPIATVNAKIREIQDLSDPDITVRGAAGDRETVAEFKLKARTTILVELLAGATAASEGDVQVLSRGHAGSTGLAEKILVYSGLVTLDEYGRPTGAELTKIAADDADPGRLIWSIADSSDLFDRRGGTAFQLKVGQPQQPDYDAVNKWLHANISSSSPPADLLASLSSGSATPAGMLGLIVILYYLWKQRGEQNSTGELKKESGKDSGQDDLDPDSHNDGGDDG